MKDCIGIINLDEKEDNISELITNNTIAAMPIAGRYKIIDFVLSNLTNSGIECIGIFAKRKSYSLLKHLSNGRPWDLHRKKEGLRVFNYSDYNPVYDDVHSFIENIEFIKFSRKDYIIISPSYMICNIDYEEVLEEHKNSGNDITLVYKKERDRNRFSSCEEIVVNDRNKVKNIKYINNGEYETYVNMEMYIMKTSLFINIVRECIMSGLYRKVKDYIKDNLSSLTVGAYEFKGYLSCINSVNTYFQANKELLDMKVSEELFYNSRPIFTKQKDEAPVFYSKKSKINNSIIANGSYIEGNLENCVLGRKVIVKEGALITNSVLMDNVVIEKNIIINNSIVTSKAIIKENQIVKEKNKDLKIL